MPPQASVGHLARRCYHLRLSHREPPDHHTANGSSKAGTFSSAEGVDVSEAAKAAIKRLMTEDYLTVALDILKIAMRSAESFQQVLDVLYVSACRNPDGAAVYTRLAHHLQTEASQAISVSMPSPKKMYHKQGKYYRHGKTGKPRKIMKLSDDEDGDWKGPVTDYLWHRCSSDWDSTRLGIAHHSAQHISLALPQFVGHMTKIKMFPRYEVPKLVARLLTRKPPPGTAQFVALYHLLRIVGGKVEGPGRSSNAMDWQFIRINKLVKSKDITSDARVLGEWICMLRSHGWKEDKMPEQSEEELTNVLERFKKDGS